MVIPSKVEVGHAACEGACTQSDLIGDEVEGWRLWDILSCIVFVYPDLRSTRPETKKSWLKDVAKGKYKALSICVWWQIRGFVLWLKILNSSSWPWFCKKKDLSFHQTKPRHCMLIITLICHQFEQAYVNKMMLFIHIFSLIYHQYGQINKRIVLLPIFH